MTPDADWLSRDGVWGRLDPYIRDAIDNQEPLQRLMLLSSMARGRARLVAGFVDGTATPVVEVHVQVGTSWVVLCAVTLDSLDLEGEDWLELASSESSS